MKLQTAIIYRLTYQIKSMLIYLGFFFLFACLIPIAAIFISGTNETVKSDILFSGMIFMAVLSFIGINSDFKLFLQNGVSRKNNFLANLITNTFLAFGFALVMKMIEKIFALPLIPGFQFRIFLVEDYTEKFIPSFLLLFFLLLFGSTIGLVFGVINDRFLGTKKLLILLTLLMVPVLLGLFAQIIGNALKMKILDFLKAIVGVTNKGMEAAPLVRTLIVICFINTFITYIMNRKREIKRIND